MTTVTEINKYISDRMQEEVLAVFSQKVCPVQIGKFEFDHASWNRHWLTGIYNLKDYPNVELQIQMCFPSNTTNNIFIVLADTFCEHEIKTHTIYSLDEFNDSLDNLVNSWVEEEEELV